MARPKVLLVEDMPDMQLVVTKSIGEICELITAGSIAEAEKELVGQEYALLILDVRLPDGNGFELCRRIRASEEKMAGDPEWGQHRFVPIIFLTGEGEIDARVQGFELGADDYVVKPIEPREFKARVESKLRRGKIAHAETSFNKGCFRIDWPLQRAFLRQGTCEEPLSLTPIEFKLLVQFLRHENRVFKREELLEAVWGSSVHVSGHTVDTHISSLRKKIGEHGRYIRAIIKQSYTYSTGGL